MAQAERVWRHTGALGKEDEVGRRDGSSGTKSPRDRGGRDGRGQGQDTKGGCPEAGPVAGRLPRRSHPPRPQADWKQANSQDVAARVTTQLRPWGADACGRPSVPGTELDSHQAGTHLPTAIPQCPVLLG